MPSLDALLRDGLAASVLNAAASAKEVFIALRKDGATGSGSEDNPFNGAGYVNDNPANASRFDAVMIGLEVAGTAVHVGPGTFITRGRVQGVWNPLPGQRVVGSGMYATTLKLDLYNSNTMSLYSVFDHALVNDPPLDGYEISDLTIDCNLAGQPYTSGYDYPRIAVGAIALRGRNILIRRVRVINFGTNTPTGLTNSRECFPLAVAAADHPDAEPRSSNCVVEDCIVEQPAVNNARETTCIALTAGETAELKADYHEDCTIRRNYVNCEYVRATDTKPALRVQSLTRNGTTATLTTCQAHGRVVSDWIVVSGATDPGGGTYQQLGLTAVWNGSFQVASVSQDGKSLTYVMDSPPASASAGGEIWLGKAPNALVTLAGIYENLGTTSIGKLDGTISQVGSICTFNFSGGVANPFAVGEVVEITKAADGALLGNYEVTGTAANSFTFTEEDEVPSVTYKAARAYTVGQLWIEDNIIELALYPAWPQSHVGPSGIRLTAPAAFNGLPMIRNALGRGNLIRHFGGVVDPAPPGKSRGVDVSCCRGLIVESNLIGVENADWAVRHYHCGKVKAFNNLTFAGQPLYALKWDVDPNVHTPELRTKAEDLFLRSLC